MLGLNLSFCTKRWVMPALWAPLVRGMGVDTVQFSFDLVDPTWPGALLDRLADELQHVAASEGIAVHSAFIGLAHYTHCQLLHPDPEVRDVAEHWMRGAYRFAGRAGIRGVGGPLGAIASRPDGQEPDAILQADYADLVVRLHRLSAVAQAEGLDTLYIEPTPMRREWPWTVAQAQRMAADLAGAALPWRWCLDWGHGTVMPLYGPGASMEPWLAALAPDVGLLHLQQTDGQADRHWDFTEPGMVDPAVIAGQLASHGLQDRPVFLEVFYPFERPDAVVLQGVAQSMKLLRLHFA